MVNTMATPTSWNTLSKEGVDVTTYYVVSASTTPETPAPPFNVGELCLGTNGSEYVFVQASTTINLGSFLAIQNGYYTNGLTSTNVVSSLGCRIGITGAVASTNVSLTYIPAGAYFWAATRGSSIAGTQTTAQSLTNVQLFTSATAGVITSVTTSSSLAAGLAGIECVSSTTPLFNLTWPRAVAVYSSAGGTLSIIANA